jgi:hypothetical protein
MFISLCRRLWNRNAIRSGGKCPRGGRHLSCRPRLEPLEDRMPPAGWDGGGLAFAPVPAPAGGLPQTGGKPLAGTAPIRVTVDQGSGETVLDLGVAFAAVGGLQHGDGLKLSILGNTNSGLVKTDLSEAALTLTYARGKHGTATITVCATDRDGVSVKQTVQVTVRPPRSAGTAHAAPLPAGLPAPMAPPTPR